MTTPTATDAFSQVIERAVESGVRKALKLSEVINRRLFSVGEAANLLGIGKRTLEEMIANDEIPTVAVRSRRMLDIQDLNSWIERNKH